MPPTAPRYSPTMTRLSSLLRTCTLPLLLAAAITPWHQAFAQPSDATPAPTLRDAWLAAAQQQDIDWGYAFILRSRDSERISTYANRLPEELQVIATQRLIQGSPAESRAMLAWREALLESGAEPRRTPGRADLPMLLNRPRLNVPLEEIAQFGYCSAPEWVEVWSFNGVTRLAWHPGMTVMSALKALGSEAYASSDTASLVSPSGDTVRLGIASWNAQNAPLAPGARLVVEIQANSASGDWVNAVLPWFLASRLPGDQCTQFAPSAPVQGVSQP